MSDKSIEHENLMTLDDIDPTIHRFELEEFQKGDRPMVVYFRELPYAMVKKLSDTPEEERGDDVELVFESLVRPVPNSDPVEFERLVKSNQEEGFKSRVSIKLVTKLAELVREVNNLGVEEPGEDSGEA